MPMYEVVSVRSIREIRWIEADSEDHARASVACPIEDLAIRTEHEEVSEDLVSVIAITECKDTEPGRE